MKTKQFLSFLGIALLSASIALLANRYLSPNKQLVIQQGGTPAVFTRASGGNLDFTAAAENSLEAVVHVKTRAAQQRGEMTIFDFFYGGGQQQQQEAPMTGSGSGVIISGDGYIVTNNHVIEGSSEIDVTLNDNRTFKAKLVGTDPTTDIALLKIEGKDLHSIPWGNSDDIKVGEWVLAVGNPFNLTSTVTAGIVSAKGRNINIIDKKMAIESFIQTDAAVNPGNSGGALVNVNGELVGINSAIASRTGSFSGYSFAVPSGIVKKVVGDIIEYGNVQRAVLGVAISTMSSELAEQFKLDMKAGVLITDLNVGGSAAQAGLRTNDIISKIEGVAVTKSSELQEQIGRHRPGDKVRIEYIRNGTVAMATVTLQNTNGNTAIVKADSMEALGATLASVPTKEKSRLGITHGMQITGLKTGKLMRSGIQEGFVIVKMNNTFIDTIKDIQDAIAAADKGVMVSGIYPNGAVAYYAFGLD